MYGSLIFGTIFLFSSICFGAADAASPILTLDPNPALSTGDRDGTTRITWSTGDDSVGQVYVSIDKGPENLFAQNSTGSQDITWIKANTKYEFKLYKGTEDRKLLKTVVVTMFASVCNGLVAKVLGSEIVTFFN